MSQLLTLYRNYLKLNSYTPDNWKQLSERMLVISKSVLGINNPLTMQDIREIVSFLKEHYADFTLEEISNAFNLYAKGTIQTDTKPYGVLSTTFIGEVLNEYRMLRGMALRIEKKDEDNEQPLLQQENATTDSKAEYYRKKMTQNLVAFYVEHKAFPITWDYSAVFLYLEEEGKIALSVDDKKDFFALVEDEMKEAAEAVRMIDRNRYERMRSEYTNRKFIVAECRKRLAQKYIETNYTNDESTNGKTN